MLSEYEVQLVRKVYKVMLVLLGLKVLQVPQVLGESRDFKAFRDFMALKGYRVLKAKKVLLAIRAPKVQPAMTVRSVPKELRVTPGRKVRPDLRVQGAHQERAFRDQPVR